MKKVVYSIVICSFLICLVGCSANVKSVENNIVEEKVEIDLFGGIIAEINENKIAKYNKLNNISAKPVIHFCSETNTYEYYEDESQEGFKSFTKEELIDFVRELEGKTLQ